MTTREQSRVPLDASIAPARTGVLQRKCACGGLIGLSGSCAECQQKKLLGKPVQTKLRINEPGDRYEQEADRVADHVMRMPEITSERARRPRATGRLVQRREAGSGSGMSEAPSLVHDVLSSPGQPLDSATRAFFEPRFGHDFSQVRVHADGKAAESAQTVNALAYTVGRDVVFGAGQYPPFAVGDRKLLAHELAHVVQQGGSTTQSATGIGRTGEPLDTQADRVGNAVANAHETLGERRSLGKASVGRLMRTIAYDADCQPNQEEVEGNVSRAQASAGRWAGAALASLTRPERVGSLLRRHFNIEATNAASVGRIRSHFESIVGALDADAFTYHCRPDSDARCRTADGREVKGFAFAGRSDIFFCAPYPFQNFFGHKSLIDTLLHEAAHAHDAGFNHDTYEWQGAYPGRNPLTNADSYASFARDAALGREGPNLELSVGGLLAADPQFYIAAGVSGTAGGPALDLFNLKLGYRLAFLPGTGRQPTRAFQAGDIGLRINPIGKRVYVDVTTGAFMGLNVTDNEMMAGIANRISAGYRGERVDLGLDLNHLRDFVADEDLVIVGVRSAVRF